MLTSKLVIILYLFFIEDLIMALLSTVDFPHEIKKTEGFPHKRIDLHSHTNCSDGGLTPQSLMRRRHRFQS